MRTETFHRGDEFVIALDLPGIASDDVDGTAEHNVVDPRPAFPMPSEGDEVVVDQRTRGEFGRRLFLGDNLDTQNLAADFDRGVLRLRIRVAESSKPLTAGNARPPTLTRVVTALIQQQDIAAKRLRHRG